MEFTSVVMLLCLHGTLLLLTLKGQALHLYERIYQDDMNILVLDIKNVLNNDVQISDPLLFLADNK